MDMRKLRHAVALADTGSFGRAAEQVHLSQPALSRSIQALESELGVRLFDRDASGATPTVLGRQLLEQARPLLGGLQRLRRQAVSLRDGSRGELSLGAGPLPAATLMPPLLAGLQQTQPGLRLHLRVAPAAVLLELLRAEQIECFVADMGSVEAADAQAGARRAPPAAMQVRPLQPQQGGLFCHASHPLARRRPLRLADLRGQRFAAVQLPPALELGLRQLAAEQEEGLAPPGLICDNVFLLKEVARHSELLLACTREALAPELASGEFCALDLPELAPVRVRLALFSLAGRSASPAAGHFVQALLAAQPAKLEAPVAARRRRA